MKAFHLHPMQSIVRCDTHALPVVQDLGNWPLESTVHAGGMNWVVHCDSPAEARALADIINQISP